jgi:plasmid stabilization system protein ParE
VKIYRVGFAPDALDHVERLRSWWEANRLAAPHLFDEEFVAAVRQLETAPSTGVVYPHPRVSDEIRRLLMPRSRHHVYYTVDDAASLVWIVAVWHASRGQGPPL